MNEEERESERKKALHSLERWREKYKGFYDAEIDEAGTKIRRGSKPSKVLYKMSSLIGQTRPTPEEIEKKRRELLREERVTKADELYKRWKDDAKQKIIVAILKNPRNLEEFSYSTKKKQYHTGGSFWDYPSYQHIVEKKGSKYVIETYDGSKQDSPDSKKVSREYTAEQVAVHVADGILEGGRHNRKYVVSTARMMGVDLRERGGLEKSLGFSVFLSLCLSFFFFSSNLTGNVIGLNKTSSNIIVVTLFLVGIIGAFFDFRKNK